MCNEHLGGSNIREDLGLFKGKVDSNYNSGSVVSWELTGRFNRGIWMRWWAQAYNSYVLRTDIYRPLTGAHEYKYSPCIERFY